MSGEPEIRLARIGADLSLSEVAQSFGFTREWLRRIEIGTLNVRPDLKVRIFQTIAELQVRRRTTAAKLSQFLESEKSNAGASAVV